MPYVLLRFPTQHVFLFFLNSTDSFAYQPCWRFAKAPALFMKMTFLQTRRPFGLCAENSLGWVCHFDIARKPPHWMTRLIVLYWDHPVFVFFFGGGNYGKSTKRHHLWWCWYVIGSINFVQIRRKKKWPSTYPQRLWQLLHLHLYFWMFYLTWCDIALTYGPLTVHVFLYSCCFFRIPWKAMQGHDGDAKVKARTLSTLLSV